MSDKLFFDKEYLFPPISLLSSPDEEISEDELVAEEEALLERLLMAFEKLKVKFEEPISYTSSPSIVSFEVLPITPSKINQLLKMEDALSLAFDGRSIRTYISHQKERWVIEVPRSKRPTIYLREVMESDTFVNAKGYLNAAIGVDACGNSTVVDIAKLPHLLIGGSTGSGKSVLINNFLLSLLYTKTPDQVKLILIDPKKVEFSSYRDLPHLMMPVISNPQDAAAALMAAVEMMEERFDLFEQLHVRSIPDYNQNVDDEKLPYVVIVIDELADLMLACRNDIETPMARLAQKGRAVGIHLIVATQRVAPTVVTRFVKTFFPSTVGLSTCTKDASKLLFDQPGAERLIGRGDMLFYPVGSMAPARYQCCFESDSTVDKVCDFIRTGNSPVDYDAAFAARIEQQKNANMPKKEYNTDPDCLFCKIVAGEIPSTKVYEDKYVYAFRDIAPMAPVHVLVVPKEHIASADEIKFSNSSHVAHIFKAIPKIAAAEGLTNGYRVITNCGEDGCQTVKHLHFHILGGKKLPDTLA